MPFYTATKATFEVGGREFPRITWYKEKNLRGLYLLLCLAVLTSATNGYDGSMMNGLQSLKAWQDCKYWNREVTLCLANLIQLSITLARRLEDF